MPAPNYPPFRCGTIEGGTLTPYPHLSWFAHELVVAPPKVFLLHEYRGVAHRLIVCTDGEANITWTTRGADRAFRVTPGDVGFFPGDSAWHKLGITAAGTYRGHEVLLPVNHAGSAYRDEDVPGVPVLAAVPLFRDAVMWAGLLRLLGRCAHGHLDEGVGAEIAAREVIVRLSVVVGGRPPDWSKDTSAFSPPMMRRIVARIDEKLRRQPSLDDISRGFGLSPSHFARKFRQSTGLSLQRFMNRRRIGLALDLLKTAAPSIAQLSLDLGFCSQSHFTRLFSSLTGLTPHQFRRKQRPAHG